jgi:DNA repair protein RadB
MVTIQTGIKCIDNLTNGGISPETVTLIYGEPDTGKSTLVMQCAVNCTIQKFKVLYIDCDNTFYTKRLAQIAKEYFDEIAERIILMKPKNFWEQAAVVDQIQDYTGKNVGLIIIDTLTSLYGAKVSESSFKTKAFSTNRELNRQLAILAQTAKIQKIPVIVTSQVRSVLADHNSSIRPVATRVLKFWADTIIALKPTHNHQTIKAVLEKTQETEQEATCYVQIGESGIKDTQFQQNG